jgi:hypothetical protein
LFSVSEDFAASSISSVPSSTRIAVQYHSNVWHSAEIQKQVNIKDVPIAKPPSAFQPGPGSAPSTAAISSPSGAVNSAARRLRGTKWYPPIKPNELVNCGYLRRLIRWHALQHLCRLVGMFVGMFVAAWLESLLSLDSLQACWSGRRSVGRSICRSVRWPCVGACVGAVVPAWVRVPIRAQVDAFVGSFVGAPFGAFLGAFLEKFS